MLPKLFISSLFAVLLVNCIECQQMVHMMRSAATQSAQTAQQQSAQPSQPQTQSQPQLLSLEQQQQLLQQLAILQQQQQQSQRQQQQQQQPQQQFYQPSAAQQFFDQTGQQLPPFFGPQSQGPPPQQQFFNPQQFSGQPQYQQQQSPQQSQPQIQAQPPAPSQGPQINWGKCPQLEPSEKEKQTKAQVITKCLETTPLPSNITRDSVEVHREQIAACALQSEGWFTSAGAYDFTKAETEIKNKQMTKQIEDQVLGYHKQCKEEAEEKFPNTKTTVIAQIQLYQACMDYFISDVCGIEVNEPDTPQFTGPATV